MIERIKQFVKEQKEAKELRQELDLHVQPLRNRTRLVTTMKAFENLRAHFYRDCADIGQIDSRSAVAPEMSEGHRELMALPERDSTMAGKQIPMNMEQASQFFQMPGPVRDQGIER